MAGIEKPTILLTGASGLLGRQVLNSLAGRSGRILALYHGNPGPELEYVSWLRADLADAPGIAAFIEKNSSTLGQVTHLVNCYGPLDCIDTLDLKGADLMAAMSSNLLPAVELVRIMLYGGRLQCLLSVGFEGAGEVRAYRRILAYALAKNALLLHHQSLAAARPDLRVYFLSPVNLAGAEHSRPGGAEISPEKLAAEIAGLLFSDQQSSHLKLGW